MQQAVFCERTRLALTFLLMHMQTDWLLYLEVLKGTVPNARRSKRLSRADGNMFVVTGPGHEMICSCMQPSPVTCRPGAMSRQALLAAGAAESSSPSR